MAPSLGRVALAAEAHGVSLKGPGAGKHSSGRIEEYQIVGLSSTASSNSHCDEHATTPVCTAAARADEAVALGPGGCPALSLRRTGNRTGAPEAMGSSPGAAAASTTTTTARGAAARFQPGDEVYANLLDHGYGGFAEYVSVPVGVLSLKPASLSFEEAAAVPMAATTAFQGLGHHGALQPTHKVLINGASGGVGSFAVQLAKASGAEVTAVTSTRNLELVRSLGADQVVDYTTTDFTRGGRRYDRILDTVGNRSVPDLRRALAEGGKAAVTGFTSVAKLLGVSLRGGKNIAQVQAHVIARDLELLSELIAAGKVRPKIDRRYLFTEIPAAIAYLEQGHARGKVVVAVA